MLIAAEQLEKKYGDLQSKYDAWRRETDEANKHKTSGKLLTDCAFLEARESFSTYCGMAEVIPFDVMLWYENCFEGKKKNKVSDGDR